MNNVERFRNLMNFKPVDRLPVIEWAFWWDQTVERWHKEGLQEDLKEAGEIREHFGLDRYRYFWVTPQGGTCPKPESHGAGLIKNREDYLKLKKHLFPEPGFDRETLKRWGEKQDKGELVIWFTLNGFFWFPREIFGIEQHLYAFYDNPDLMHEINRDLLEFNIRVIEEISGICKPCFMSFAEDLSYNNGPMLSKNSFDEFLAPYYLKIIPFLNKYNIVPFMDSDGDITSIIPWLYEIGVEGLLPLEKMAGVDIVQIRKIFPDFKMIGAFDKTVMHHGEKAIREEFERLLPVMKQGGYIPSVDHQTPPEVSMEDYKLYVKLLKEYCNTAD